MKKIQALFYDDVIYTDHLYTMYLIKRRNKNLSERPEVDVWDILKLVGCKIFIGKLKWTHESFSTASGLRGLVGTAGKGGIVKTYFVKCCDESLGRKWFGV